MADVPDSCHVAGAGDPDVAGLGVIVAFLASITIAAATVLLLYIWEGLPHKQYNRIDRDIIWFFPIPSVEIDGEVDPQRKKLRHAVEVTLQKLLLNLSDQQLFFGLALVLTIYIRMSKLDAFSVYSFRMATTSVWLSCITHMSVIVALRDQFYPKVGRGWRVLAMVVLLLLLAPILVLSNLPSFIFDPSLSFRCAWNQISTYNRAQTRNFALVAASAVIMTVGGYTSRIIAIYKPIRRRSRIGRRWKRKLIHGIKRREARGYWPRRLKIPWRLVLYQLIQGLKESFLWQLMWLAFYFTFGMTSLVRAWIIVPPLQQWSLSFAQLVPIVLLVSALPPAYDTFQEHVKRESTETASESEVEIELDSDNEIDSEIESVSEFEFEPGSGRPSSLTVCLNLMGAKGYVFLIVMGLIVFVWQLFMALLIGGAFFTAMEDSPPRSWTGVSISFGFSAVAPTTGKVVQASYNRVVQQERQQERQEQREQERQQERQEQLEVQTEQTGDQVERG